MNGCDGLNGRPGRKTTAWLLLALPFAVVTLGAGSLSGDGGQSATAPLPQIHQPECEVSPRMDVEGRASPLDSASVEIAGETVKVCYGAPSARGRTMIGGEAVPHGELWRTGANEPTMIHLTTHALVAGIGLEPGAYSLYTIPGEEEWQLFISRSTEHWGLAIDEEVRAQEVGEAVVPREHPPQHVETLTVRFEEEMGDSATMILEWEDYRIRVPIELVG